MKKVIQKIKNRKSQKQSPATRITNNTVAEHREKVLAGGRRFKYPVQYARHKLIINAVGIALVAIVLFMTFVWWQLYIVQSSNAFFYRITQIAPLPVASIDGHNARFSTYLLNYRGSEYYLDNFDQISVSSDAGKVQLEYKKRSALDNAIQDAYAQSIAAERGIVVEDKEVESAIEEARKTSSGTTTPEAFEASLRKVLGLSSADYRTLLKNGLLRSKAAFAIDDAAQKAEKDIAQQLAKKNDIDMKAIAEAYQKKGTKIVTYGEATIDESVSIGGISGSRIANIKPADVATSVKSNVLDGYYFFKVLSKEDDRLRVAFVRVALTEFDTRIATLKKQNKVKEYIKIDIENKEKEEKK